jgi:uncharacterized protein YuzE
MRLKIDSENDALYLRLDETAIVDSEEIKPGVVLDYNKDDKVVGVEILNISPRVSAAQLRSFQYETA